MGWERCPRDHMRNPYPYNSVASSGKREGAPPAPALATPLDSHVVFQARSATRKLQRLGNAELSSVAVLGDSAPLYMSFCSSSFRYQHHTRVSERDR